MPVSTLQVGYRPLSLLPEMVMSSSSDRGEGARTWDMNGLDP